MAERLCPVSLKFRPPAVGSPGEGAGRLGFQTRVRGPRTKILPSGHNLGKARIDGAFSVSKNPYERKGRDQKWVEGLKRGPSEEVGGCVSPPSPQWSQGLRAGWRGGEGWSLPGWARSGGGGLCVPYFNRMATELWGDARGPAQNWGSVWLGPGVCLYLCDGVGALS